MTGTQATRKITSLHKGIKVLALSQCEDGPTIKAMMAAGASGYLSKGCTTDELQEAIATVMQGKFYFGEEIKPTVQDEFVYLTRQSSFPPPNALTDREVEIVRLLTLGENPKAIADRLSISPKTVDAHRRKISAKLKIDNLADLTKYAIREKIIQVSE
jgi:DNA-binding NarL/FixJ family response regulator